MVSHHLRNAELPLQGIGPPQVDNPPCSEHLPLHGVEKHLQYAELSLQGHMCTMEALLDMGPLVVVTHL